MLKATIVIALALSVAVTTADARGWSRKSSPAAEARKDCKAKCRADYEMDALSCASMLRGERRSCRQDESANRKECLAHCI